MLFHRPEGAAAMGSRPPGTHYRKSRNVSARPPSRWLMFSRRWAIRGWMPSTVSQRPPTASRREPRSSRRWRSASPVMPKQQGQYCIARVFALPSLLHSWLWWRLSALANQTSLPLSNRHAGEWFGGRHRACRHQQVQAFTPSWPAAFNASSSATWFWACARQSSEGSYASAA